MRNIGAGFRYSSYGIGQDPGPNYWLSVGKTMSAKFPGAQPECIWIVGNFTGLGTRLSFPVNSSNTFVTSTGADTNEQALTLFDHHGFKVWLQVEPGNADVEGLIHVVMERYGHHTCVTGFGVDVEWYKSDGSAEGKPVTDKEAQSWVRALRSIHPNMRLFLKHWKTAWLPLTFQDGLLYVDDSQQFENLNHMVREFSAWGKHFAPAPVAFQFGYPADKHWWSQFQDPPELIGRIIRENVPNSNALFWVDFSIRDVFPP